MNLLEQLQNKSNKVFKEFVKGFADEIKNTLLQSAEDGYTGYSFIVEDKSEDTRHFFYNDNFCDELEKHLEGLKVSKKIINCQNLFGQEYSKTKINIRWN